MKRKNKNMKPQINANWRRLKVQEFRGQWKIMNDEKRPSEIEKSYTPVKQIIGLTGQGGKNDE